MIPQIFPKAPQSSRPESLGFPRVTPPPRYGKFSTKHLIKFDQTNVCPNQSDKQMYTPQKSNELIPKIVIFKGSYLFQVPSFWVSMLVLGSVKNYLQDPPKFEKKFGGCKPQICYTSTHHTIISPSPQFIARPSCPSCPKHLFFGTEFSRHWGKQPQSSHQKQGS